jgi:hypothetical protein
MAKLNPDQRKQLINLTENKNYVSWETYNYLCSVISDYEKFIGKVYDDFEKMYLENFKEFSK